MLRVVEFSIIIWLLIFVKNTLSWLAGKFTSVDVRWRHKSWNNIQALTNNCISGLMIFNSLFSNLFQLKMLLRLLKLFIIDIWCSLWLNERYWILLSSSFFSSFLLIWLYDFLKWHLTSWFLFIMQVSIWNNNNKIPCILLGVHLLKIMLISELL